MTGLLKVLVLIVVAVVTALGDKPANNALRQKGDPADWVIMLSLDHFNTHFEWNSFCVAAWEQTVLPEMHVYKDLLTGELKPKDEGIQVVQGRSDIYLDSRFNKTTCVDSNGISRQWVERISDEETWISLIDTKTQELINITGTETSSSLWIIEVMDAHALQHLPRDAHIHRKTNTSAFFIVAYLSTVEAKQFAIQSHPTAILPVPDILKLAPSAFILAYPEFLNGLISDDDEYNAVTQLDILVELHMSDSDLAPVHLLGDLTTKWNDWCVENNVALSVEAAGTQRALLKLNTSSPYSFANKNSSSIKQQLRLFFESMLMSAVQVVYIEARPRFKLQNQYSAAIIQNGTFADGSFMPIYDQGLSGAGQIVGVGDSGLDVLSCFFYDSASSFPQDNTNNLYPDAEKVVQYVSFADNVEGEASGHGTHVAATVAGFGGTTGSDVVQGSFSDMENYKGVAFNAKIAFYDMGYAGSSSLSVPGDIYNDFLGLAYDIGAFIHTNSWGTDVNSYTSTSRDMDRFSYDHQDFLILVACGNTGSLGFGTIGSPATAKNVVAVGASMSNAHGFADSTTGPTCFPAEQCSNYYTNMADNLASFSSLGPTFDGRMKPEVVAVGYFVSSASSSANPNAQTCAVEAKSGTSMATPVTAGAAAIIREYFVDRKGIVPMGSLIKAMLIHSGSPLSDPDWPLGLGNDYVTLNGRPDSNQGYGLVSLQKVLTFQDTTAFSLRYVGACSGSCEETDWTEMVTVDQDEIYEEVVTLKSSGNVILSATLVWADPPASSYTNSPVLINDLDLVIESADGTMFYPYTSTGDTGINTLDNSEKVEVPLNEINWGGTYTVRVSGTSVAQGPQPFALVITAPLAEEETEAIVEDIVNSLINDEDVSLVGVELFTPGIAATLGLMAFVLLAALITTVIIFAKQGKWNSMTVTVEFIYAGAVLRLVEACLAIASLILTIINTNTVVYATTLPINIAACGAPGPLIVTACVLVLVNVICVVTGLLKFALDSPLWFDRTLVITDMLMFLFLLVTVLISGIVPCGTFALFNIPAALLLICMLLLAVSLCLAFARLHSTDKIVGDLFQKLQDKNKYATGDTSVAKAEHATKDGENNNTFDKTNISVQSQEKQPIQNIQQDKNAVDSNGPQDKVEVASDSASSGAADVKDPGTVKATYDYNPSNPDELKFLEHDIIDVIRFIDEGWGHGKNTRTGETGMFPRNYCAKV